MKHVLLLGLLLAIPNLQASSSSELYSVPTEWNEIRDDFIESLNQSGESSVNKRKDNASEHFSGLFNTSAMYECDVEIKLLQMAIDAFKEDGLKDTPKWKHHAIAMGTFNGRKDYLMKDCKQ